ncbi:MAG: ATP-binding protein [Pseudomonadota bacterium]
MKASIPPLVSALVVALLVAGGCLRMNGLATQSFKMEVRAGVAERVDKLRASLEQGLNLHLRALAAAEAVILAKPDLDDAHLQRIGPTLVQSLPAIRSIAFSPAGAAGFAYTPPGSGAAAGTAQALARAGTACAARANGSGLVDVLAPLSGASGLLALAPVFVRGDDGRRAFWGCASVALDHAALLAPVAPLLADPSTEFTVRGQGLMGRPGALIAGSARMADGPVTGRVLFPGGAWEIAAQPRAGWGQPRPYRTPLYLLMLFVTVAAAYCAWTIHTRGSRNRQLLRELEAGEHARRQWVADTSHELRTPITILSTHLDALRDGMIALTPAELELLSDTVLGMERLVTDLHQLARSDASALAFEYEDVDLAELFDELRQAFAPRFAQHELTLTVYDFAPAGLAVRADRQRLMQVLSNLWSNTLRYTDRGGRASITLTHVQGRVCIRCDDSAPGVPDHALPRLFERFYRVDGSRSRAGGGSGLGLAICQSIVDAHGGQMQATHSALGGLCVEFVLPRAVAA